MTNASDLHQTARVAAWLGSGSINLFGMPFAGKDTQGKRLSELFQAPLLGGGDILRSDAKRPVPPHIKALMSRGKLIPTEDYLAIVLPYLRQQKFVGKPLILSSVGRWHGEEAGVLEATAQADHPLRVVIHLKIDEDEVLRRWQTRDIAERGDRTDDDTLEAIEIRLEEYRNKTIPVINFYRDQGLLVEVNSKQPIEAVTRDIIAELYKRAHQTAS